MYNNWIRPNANRGEGNSHSKLTEVKVRLIRDIRQYDKQITLLELAQMFGVSEVTIHQIVSRKTWRYLK